MAKYRDYGFEAETLYVRRGQTLEQVAKFLGLSVQTLSRWKKKGNWGEKRKLFMTSPQGAIGALEDVLRSKIDELRNLPAEEINSKRIDGITKLVASINRIRKEQDLRTQAIFVMQEFGQFVRARNLKNNEIDMITKLIQDFFEYVRSK